MMWPTLKAFPGHERTNNFEIVDTINIAYIASRLNRNTSTHIHYTNTHIYVCTLTYIHSYINT